jgi:hypothetical protein
LDTTLVNTFVCKTCEHNADVCTCLDSEHYDTYILKELGKPIRRIISFVDYIEGKYHESQHSSHPTQCYRQISNRGREKQPSTKKVKLKRSKSKTQQNINKKEDVLRE